MQYGKCDPAEQITWNWPMCFSHLHWWWWMCNMECVIHQNKSLEIGKCAFRICIGDKSVMFCFVLFFKLNLSKYWRFYNSKVLKKDKKFSWQSRKQHLVCIHSLSSILFADLLGLKAAPNDGTPGSLSHLLDSCSRSPVPKPQSDGNLMRSDICQYPRDQVVEKRHSCKYCVCPYCQVSCVQT